MTTGTGCSSSRKGTCAKEESPNERYEKALAHWNSMVTDVDGMLGGFGRLHQPDISASKQFLCDLRKKKLLTHFERALDCGSGIGRVTKHLLLPAFQSVDMVDFADHFLQQSHSYIKQQQPTSSNSDHSVGRRFVESLHTFEPETGCYDLIWVQWVTGHLEDQHLVDFLRRCKNSIQPRDGCIVVKDNIARGPDPDFDEADHSWTRPRGPLCQLFEEADCRIVQERRQLHFPKQLYEVRMFALKPAETS